MTRNHGKNGSTPFVSGLVNIRVANAGKFNVDGEIMGAWRAAIKRERLKWLFS
jgi:hypothetical protein